jgi:hypothetical protein
VPVFFLSAPVAFYSASTKAKFNTDYLRHLMALVVNNNFIAVNDFNSWRTPTSFSINAMLWITFTNTVF